MKPKSERSGGEIIAGHEDIRQAYRDADVAEQYIASRFVEPLGALLHEQQISRMRQVIAAANPRAVLEIAPGPARLTADLGGVLRGRCTLVDASLQMLGQARARLRSTGTSTARLVQGDAFNLPFQQGFDLVYSFRLIRHFDTKDRARLYEQIARLLAPGGLLVFDAINERVARAFREREGSAYQHFDALLSEARLTEELEAAGFSLVRLDPAQRRYTMLYQLQVLLAPRSATLARAAMNVVQQVPGGEPMEWIVTCRRR